MGTKNGYNSLKRALDIWKKYDTKWLKEIWEQVHIIRKIDYELESLLNSVKIIGNTISPGLLVKGVTNQGKNLKLFNFVNFVTLSSESNV